MKPGHPDKSGRKAKKPEGVRRWLPKDARSCSQKQKSANIEPEWNEKLWKIHTTFDQLLHSFGKHFINILEINWHQECFRFKMASKYTQHSINYYIHLESILSTFWKQTGTRNVFVSRWLQNTHNIRSISTFICKAFLEHFGNKLAPAMLS